MSPEPPLRAVAVAVVRRDGRVLVQSRPAGRDWPGFWEFPGGKCEPGESAAACAERECREELALPVRALSLLHETEWTYPGVRVHIHFVNCDLLDPATEPQPRESQRILWATREDLAQLEFLPANAEFLQRLRSELP